MRWLFSWKANLSVTRLDCAIEGKFVPWKANVFCRRRICALNSIVYGLRGEFVS